MVKISQTRRVAIVKQGLSWIVSNQITILADYELQSIAPFVFLLLILSILEQVNSDWPTLFHSQDTKISPTLFAKDIQSFLPFIHFCIYQSRKKIKGNDLVVSSSLAGKEQKQNILSNLHTILGLFLHQALLFLIKSILSEVTKNIQSQNVWWRKSCSYLH